MIVKYIRKTNGKRVGVLVAYTDACDPNHYLVGWSLCNKTDTFDRAQGMNIALARAITWSVRDKYTMDNVPGTVRKFLTPFLNRCDKVFKGKASPFAA